MSILTIEQALLAQLKARITDLAVEAFPDDPRSYKLIHAKGAVLVHYEGSLPERPVRKGTVLQREEVRFGLTVVMRNLRSTDAGAYSAIDRVRAAVLGCKLAGCGRTWINKTELLDAEDSVWQYTIGVSMLHVLVVANDNVPDTLASSIAVEHHYTSGYESRNLTTDGATDWMAALGWGVGDAGRNDLDYKLAPTSGSRWFTDLLETAQPPHPTMGWSASWAGTSPQSCTDATYSDPQTDNMMYGFCYAPWTDVANPAVFSFTVKALTTRQRMIMCMPIKNCQAKVSFALPGATTVVHQLDPAVDEGGSYNGCDAIFTVDFTAGAPGQVLTVTIYDIVHGTEYDNPVGFRYATLKPWPLVPALLAHYPFTAAPVANVVVDESTYGNDGTNVGATWRSGELEGERMVFDGSDDSIDVPDLSIDGDDDFSLAFWMKPASLASYDLWPIGFNDPASDCCFGINQYGPNVKFQYQNSLGAWGAVTGVINMEATDWVHVIAQKTGNDFALFVNNVADGTFTHDEGVGSYSAAALGCLCRNTKIAYWPGEITDVQIYNRALTAAERATAYAGGTIATD